MKINQGTLGLFSFLEVMKTIYLSILKSVLLWKMANSNVNYLQLIGIKQVASKIITHIARNEAGPFDEGAAGVEEVPESGARKMTEGHKDIQKVSQTLSVGLSQQSLFKCSF